MQCPNCGSELRANAKFCDSCGAPVGAQKPQKKKKTALIISIIALVLVLAILGGTIVYLNFFFVSAAELQEAKDAYLPPAEAFEIDTSLSDPSNDNIKFGFDDRDRIISCTYTLKEKQFDKQYTYDDVARLLTILTTYRSKPIITVDIPYDDIPRKSEGVSVTSGGEIVNSPEPVENTGNEPEVKPTEAATEEPLGEITDADADESLKNFLHYLVMNNFWEEDGVEYDARDPQKNGRNILACIARNPSCVQMLENKNIYPGKGSTVGLVSSDGCPWNTGGRKSYAYDAAEVDWICENIFYVPKAEIATLYEKANQAQRVWKDGDSYYSLERESASMGAAYQITIDDVKTDGKYTYVTYTLEFLGQKTPLYAVLEHKEIDGKYFWTLHYSSKTVPSTIEHFDPNGK